MAFKSNFASENSVQHASTALEIKFSSSSGDGTFQGYGAVFGNQDSHGDVIAPGAFAQTLAERKAANRRVAMHVMHGIYGGDGVPVGVWTNIAEDDKGLRVDGKISGMNTDAGRLLYERVKDGALGGLSIGYTVKKNGATYGTKPGEPKRLLKALNLHEISLVDDPSNAMATVNQVKLTSRSELEDLLEGSGLSRKAARMIAGAGWKALSGEADPEDTPDPKIAELLRHLDGAALDLKGMKA